MSIDHDVTSPLGSVHFRSANPIMEPSGPGALQGNWRAALGEIKGRSPALEQVLKTLVKVARSDSPVLVYGESGTGKELVAKALHRLSQRANRRFLAINCSAIPESLLESELFGYVKGAFTGAETRRKGLFEEAAGGTIFLDEVGDMALRLQAKLLRVIQEKQFSPVGSNEVKQVDVRIVAATNVNLEQAVEQKTFRLDLFYRLNVLPIQLPPLRERSSDVTVLLEHFLKIANSQHRLVNPCYFSPKALNVLEHYPWPGNVRELQNLVERLVVMTGGGEIGYDDLPREYRNPNISSGQPISSPAPLDYASHSNHVVDMGSDTDPSSLQEIGESQEPCDADMSTLDNLLLPEQGVNLTHFIEQLENNFIMQALHRTGNNKNQAARLLGLNRTTLVERIKKRRLVPLNSPSKEL